MSGGAGNIFGGAGYISGGAGNLSGGVMMHGVRLPYWNWSVVVATGLSDDSTIYVESLSVADFGLVKP